MRVWKIAAIGVGAVVAVIGLAVGWVLLVFDPNDYKADIEQLAQEKTGRKLVLQGDLSLSIFPWLAVELGPAQLSERPDFSAGDATPFIAFQKARLSVKLWPLLTGNVQIGDVLLREPSIRLITDEQGRHNWDDLTATKAGSDTPTESSGSVSATVDGLDIEGGEVILDDRQAKERTALQAFALKAEGIGRGKPFDLQSSFHIEQAASSADVRIKTNVNADWDAKRYTLGQFATDVQWRQAGGAELPIAVRAATLALDMAQQTAQLDGMELSIGDARLSGSMHGQEVLDAPKFEGRLILAPVALRPLLKQAGVEAPATRDAQVLSQLSFESDVTATAQSVALQKIVMKLDDTTARGEFAIADFDAKALRFDLDVDNIDLDRYLPPTTPETAESKAAAASPPTPIPVDTLRTLNARGELRIGAAKFSGLKLSALRVAVTARDGDVRIAPAEAQLYGGNYRGEIGLQVATPKPRLTMTTQVANVDFAPLLKDMIQMDTLTGRGDLNMKIGAVGADTQAMLQDLDGQLDFKVNDGAYLGLDLWYEIRRARAVLRQQPIPERTGPRRTDFSSIQGTGRIENGVLDNRDLVVATQYLKVDGQGQVNLPAGTLDYGLKAKVLRIPPEGTEGSELRELVDAEIPIKVSGPLDDPKVRPDLNALVKSQVKEAVDKEKDKLQQKLQDKLKDLLNR